MPTSLKKVFIITDFGYKDYYVAAMKSVILDLYPYNITFIDVTHEVEPGDILDASFIAWQLSLLNIYNSGVLVVVDPGVGSQRDAILIECEKNNVLVGPDNGVLYPLASTLGIKKIYYIDYTNQKYFVNVSQTFHGRDVFARALGLYFGGDREFLKEKENIVDNDIFIYSYGRDRIVFKVLHIDRFGNVITNIPCYEEIPNKINLWAKGKVFLLSKVNTFSELKRDELGLLCGSSGFYEIVSYLKPASEVIKLRSGDTAMIILSS
ncbi:MAG TPA: hypothetical protein EYH44_03395 [Thermoprotei archaeon]|nr:hypothetical protein [Thermoprotei archaeon]